MEMRLLLVKGLLLNVSGCLGLLDIVLAGQFTCCQQPDRLYHRTTFQSFVTLPDRYRPDGRGADFPCERR